MEIARSGLAFVLAAGCELGGAYLVWQWLRSGRTPLLGVAGAILLVLYATIQTTQSFSFGRAFAAYGGVFIAMAMLWGWRIDGHTPDRADWLGMAICLLGAVVIAWGRRGAGA